MQAAQAESLDHSTLGLGVLQPAGAAGGPPGAAHTGRIHDQARSPGAASWMWYMCARAWGLADAPWLRTPAPAPAFSRWKAGQLGCTEGRSGVLCWVSCARQRAKPGADKRCCTLTGRSGSTLPRRARFTRWQLRRGPGCAAADGVCGLRSAGRRAACARRAAVSAAATARLTGACVFGSWSARSSVDFKEGPLEPL